MLLKIHPENPQERLIQKVRECLENDGVIIYPTDTVYGIGCDLKSKRAFETICKIRGIKPEHARFSILCSDFKMVGTYATRISTPVYKMLRRGLPGPYTFILEASHEVPRFFQPKKKTVGIRMSAHPIPAMIIEMLGRPLVSTSLRSSDEIVDYNTDPEMIEEHFGKLVDIVIDGGYGNNVPSTVIDCSKGDADIEVIREGIGSLEILR